MHANSFVNAGVIQTSTRRPDCAAPLPSSRASSASSAVRPHALFYSLSIAYSHTLPPLRAKAKPTCAGRSPTTATATPLKNGTPAPCAAASSSSSARQLEFSASSPSSWSSSNSNSGVNGTDPPVVKTECAGNGAVGGADQLYHLPGPDPRAQRHVPYPPLAPRTLGSHSHSHSQSQSGHSSLGDLCTYVSVSASSSYSPALGYYRYNLGNGMYTGSSYAVLALRALAGSDLYYHQPYICGSISNGVDKASSESCMCRYLMNLAAVHSHIALTHQLTQSVEFLRQLPEHTHYQNSGARGCTILKSIGAVRELIHGGTLTSHLHPSHLHPHTHTHTLLTPSLPFEPLPTPVSEIMSPVMPTGHASAAPASGAAMVWAGATVELFVDLMSSQGRRAY
ncbi:hypothetical protein EIP86_009974 [Pleurotus ostreatoroseus]|nr:hypothetical protein EIP86_009974 [Pleurotus ostreatoroseus]